ncbi:AAA family ATPase [Kitasatospora sp. RG8]|uniref:AAA family ATPase n=1 Tax=Kitasatospora sp. RG8 TaxID=2820815 RepID=UPI001ADF17CD|nr:AAA family ATPase [Kitasatospora sp. RG8]MBP0453996.1 AAA family ATPase [Kitasatospora sp. RG8]
MSSTLSTEQKPALAVEFRVPIPQGTVGTDKLLQALAEDVRPRRLHELSVLCEHKMRLPIWAARLSVARPHHLRRSGPLRRGLTNHHLASERKPGMADWRDRMTPDDHAMVAAHAPIARGTLVVLIGPAGSGKTTYTRAVPSSQVVSLDDLRALVTGGDPGDQSATAAAAQIHDLVLEGRLLRGRTVVCDSTNVEAAVRARLVERARRHGRPLLAIVMTTPLDTCLRRNSERPPTRRVPDDVLRWQHQLATEALPGLADEGFDEVRLHPAVSRSGR